MKSQETSQQRRSRATSLLLQRLVVIQLLQLLILSQRWTSIKANTIPRSTSSRSIDPSKPRNLPPWNSSPHIDSDGFLSSLYRRIHGEWEEELRVGGRWFALDEPVYIRQVPGDGSCLFHSCTVALSLVANKTHIDMNSMRQSLKKMGGPTKELADDILMDADCDSNHYDLTHLYHHSRYLRKMAVDILSQNPRRLLFLQGNEYLRARDLVSAAASQYDLSPKEYCDQMRNDSYWGGGPEIVALCNFLKRPIHVYELYSNLNEDGQQKDISKGGGYEMSKRRRRSIMPRYEERQDSPHHQFRLRRMACFGSPKFDKREPLNILSADSRFPDIEPGQQVASGNHFLALFPESLIEKVEDYELERIKSKKLIKRKYKRTGIRGGHDYSSVVFHDRQKSKNAKTKSTNSQLSFCDRFKQYFVFFFPFTAINEEEDEDKITMVERRWFHEKLLDRLKLVFM